MTVKKTKTQPKAKAKTKAKTEKVKMPSLKDLDPDHVPYDRDAQYRVKYFDTPSKEDLEEELIIWEISKEGDEIRARNEYEIIKMTYKIDQIVEEGKDIEATLKEMEYAISVNPKIKFYSYWNPKLMKDKFEKNWAEYEAAKKELEKFKKKIKQEQKKREAKYGGIIGI